MDQIRCEPETKESLIELDEVQLCQVSGGYGTDDWAVLPMPLVTSKLIHGAELSPLFVDLVM